MNAAPLRVGRGGRASRESNAEFLEPIKSKVMKRMNAPLQTKRCLALLLVATLMATLSLGVVANAQQPANDEAAADKPDVDHYAVPTDADVKTLLDFLNTVRRPAEPIKSRAAMVDHMVKTAAAVDVATDKIMAANPTDRQLATAVREKLRALETLQQVGQGDAGKRLEEFITKSLKSDVPEVRGIVKQAVMQMTLRNWPRLSADDRNKFFADATEIIEQGNLDGSHLQMMSAVVRAAEQSGNQAEAIALVTAAIPQFAKSQDKMVQERIGALDGMLTRLKLPGSKLEIEGTLVNGEPVDWTSYRGKVVLVDFWATWCGPCRAEVPNIVKNYEAYSDKGFTVLGVSLDNNKQQVEEYLTKENLPWQSLYSNDESANGWLHPMAVKYGVDAIPRAILVDKDGVVVHMNARGPALGNQLEKLLGPVDESTTDASKDDAAKTAQAE